MFSQLRSFSPHKPDNRSELVRKPSIDEYLKEVSFEQAFAHSWIRRKALQVNGSAVPKEFTEFVLRKYAICERGCRHFAAKLSDDVRRYLINLIGLHNTDVLVKPVHSKSLVKPNGFLGVLIRYFFKKLIFNLKNESGRYEYAQNYTCIFPFRVSSSVPVYYIDILNLFDDDFYSNMQTFLKDHFTEEPTLEARKICHLFLANIRHFQANEFSEEALLKRLENILCDAYVNEDKTPDYLDTFPRLSDEGVEWFIYLYKQFKVIRKTFHNVDEPISKYDHSYFKSLPETNFVDLYSLLEGQLYTRRRPEYTKLFQKYLFFFVHSLRSDAPVIFFIDDVLFECLKCLHHVKTSRQDIELVKELALLSLVHLRTKPEMEDFNTDYRIPMEVLLNIKKYALSLPDIQNAQIDIEFKTDFLHGWMLLRTVDTCFEMCYSTRERKYVNYFLDRILCSVLCPDDEPIKYIVFYNAYLGQESKIVMPEVREKVRNFLRISNLYDFSKQTPQDEFLTKDLERYFAHLSITR